ncbi:hypothetical protein HK096_000989 [Nowakowskiella sp. JEL0078]|nr:hypothetical protein HK096_000989 [Nowakowskiella sp. JEL0078]
MGKSKIFPIPEYNPKVVGPLKNRKCRDVPFLILFVCFWVGMYIIGVLAIQTGDPRRLIAPNDSWGNLCGVNNTETNSSMRDLTTRKYLYWINPLEPLITLAICIEECPTITIIPTNPSTTICSYNTATFSNVGDFIKSLVNGTCAPFIYESKPILNRCIPAALDSITKLNASIFDSNYTVAIAGKSVDINVNEYVTQGRSIAMQVLNDIVAAWPYLVIGAGLAVVASFIWLLLLRLIPALMVWFTIFFVDIIFVFGTIWMYFYWKNKKNEWDLTPENQRIQSAQWEVYALLGTTIFAAK